MKLGFRRLCCVAAALLFSFNIPNVTFHVKANELSSTVEKGFATTQSESSGNVVVIQEVPAGVGQQIKNAKSDKDATTTFLLAYLGGFLGLHRFYVGKTGTGILYLFTLGLLGIGPFIDIIRIVLGDFKDCKNLPVKFE